MIPYKHIIIIFLVLDLIISLIGFVLLRDIVFIGYVQVITVIFIIAFIYFQRRERKRDRKWQIMKQKPRPRALP